MTVTAAIHSGGSGADAPLTIIDPALVTQSDGGTPGLGVRRIGGRDSSELDARGPNEFLRFTFNKEVTCYPLSLKLLGIIVLGMTNLMLALMKLI